MKNYPIGKQRKILGHGSHSMCFFTFLMNMLGLLGLLLESSIVVVAGLAAAGWRSGAGGPLSVSRLHVLGADMASGLWTLRTFILLVSIIR